MKSDMPEQTAPATATLLEKVMSKYEPTREELEAFIRRAGFTYGWENLESWARRMAEQGCLELHERESAKAVVTDEVVTVARDAYTRIRSLNWECENDTLAWRTSLEAVAPMLASARVPDGWELIPLIGTSVKADHPITCLNPDEYFDVHEVQVKSTGISVRGENTCWFGLALLAAAPKPEKEE